MTDNSLLSLASFPVWKRAWVCCSEAVEFVFCSLDARRGEADPIRRARPRPRLVVVIRNPVWIFANGAVESTLQQVRLKAGILITQKKAEGASQIIFPCTHSMYCWALLHAAWSNRYIVKQGTTAERSADRMHRKTFLVRWKCFGGYIKPDRKGAPRWCKGIWLGKTLTDDTHIIGYKESILWHEACADFQIHLCWRNLETSLQVRGSTTLLHLVIEWCTTGIFLHRCHLGCRWLTSRQSRSRSMQLRTPMKTWMLSRRGRSLHFLWPLPSEMLLTMLQKAKRGPHLKMLLKALRPGTYWHRTANHSSFGWCYGSFRWTSKSFALGRVLPGQRDGSVLWYRAVWRNTCPIHASWSPRTVPVQWWSLLMACLWEKELCAWQVGRKTYHISMQCMEHPGDEIAFLKRLHVLHHDGRMSIQTHGKHISKLCTLLGMNPKVEDKKSPAHSDIGREDTTEDLPADATTFRTCVGILMYLANDIPHCQYVVRHLSTYSSKPTQKSLIVLRHLVSYLASHGDISVSLKWSARNSGIYTGTLMSARPSMFLRSLQTAIGLQTDKRGEVSLRVSCSMAAACFTLPAGLRRLSVWVQLKLKCTHVRVDVQMQFCLEEFWGSWQVDRPSSMPTRTAVEPKGFFKDLVWDVWDIFHAGFCGCNNLSPVARWNFAASAEVLIQLTLARNAFQHHDWDH